MRADPVLNEPYRLSNTPTHLPCLTICQPWAWAIMAGHKPVENRTWATNYRGPLLIHAGKSRQWMDAGQQFLADMHLTPPELEFGAVLGLVELVDVVPILPRQFCPWSSGPLCWALANPKLIKPVPMSGRQGLFRVAVDSVPGLASHLK